MLFSNRDLRKLLIPLALEELLTGFLGIADTLMVTRVGDTAISAVSCVDAINNLMLYLFAALATGGTVVCAQYLGRKDTENANRAARQVFLVTLALSLVLAAVCLVLRRQILVLVFGGVEERIMDQALSYFRITAISYPFLALQQTSAALFRAEGNSRLPMVVTAAANLLNIGGNAALIFGLGLGVTGAALSTLASRIVSCVALLVFQRRRSNVICIRNYRAFRPERGLIAMVLKIALPSGVENGLFQLGRLLVQSTVSTLGTTAIAAQAMTFTLDLIESTPAMAIGLGLLTVAGQCMGAGRPQEARYYTKKICLISECVVAGMGCAILAATPLVVRVSGLSPEAGALTFRLMIAITVVKILIWVPSFVLPYTLRAAGDVMFTAAGSTASMWIFRVAFSAVLCRVLGVGLAGVWIAWFVDWACRVCFYVWRYHSGRWEKKEVLAPAEEPE